MKLAAGAKSRDFREKSSIVPLKSRVRCFHGRSGCFSLTPPLLLRALHLHNAPRSASSLCFFAAFFFTLAPRAHVCRGRFGPVDPRAPRGRKESAVKPGSVLDSHSSGMRVAAQL